MLIFYILLIIGRKEHRPNWKNPLLIAVTIFTGLYILTSITGVNLYRSFWGTLERMGGVFSFIHYWIFFVILISVFTPLEIKRNDKTGEKETSLIGFKSKQDWLKLLKLSVIAGFLSILFAYGQYFKLGNFFVGWQHEGRVIGTMGNAALFAGYLIFILFLALYLLLNNKTKKYEKWFYGMMLILGIPALFLTVVRGSIISFLGALFLLGIFSVIISKKKQIKIGALAFLILLIIFVSIFWTCRNQPWTKENTYLNRITDISLETKTIQTRIATWKSALQGWQEKPWLGWGPENFNILFAKHFDPMHYEGFGSEVVWDRAHNTFLNIGATMGVIGLLSYLSIFIVLFIYFIKAFKKRLINRYTLGVLGAMLIAYIGHNMFIFDTFNSYLMFFIVLGFLSSLFIHPEIPELETKKRDIDKIAGRRKAFAIIFIPIVFFTIWETAIIPAKANYAATRGIVYGRSENHFSSAFDYFRKSLSYNAIQTEYEVRHHLARFVFRIFNEGDNVQKFGVEEKDIIFAVDEIKKNIKTDPLDPIPYLYAGRLNEFLSRVNQGKAKERLNEAEGFFRTAESLNEKNPYIYFELGQVRIFQNRRVEAIKFFDKGISIKPEVELGYWYKGVTYLDMGKIKKSEEFIQQATERGYKKSVNDIHRLLRIYVPLKNYPKIIELYLEMIKLEPNNAQFYAYLATAYKEDGQIDKAIESARKVGGLDPKLKLEADAWVHILEAKYK